MCTNQPLHGGIVRRVAQSVNGNTPLARLLLKTCAREPFWHMSHLWHIRFIHMTPAAHSLNLQKGMISTKKAPATVVSEMAFPASSAVWIYGSSRDFTSMSYTIAMIVAADRLRQK